MAGAGAAWYALVLTGLIVFVNLGLRQVVKWLKRKTKAGVPLILDYQVRLQCNEADEAEVRATILRCFALPGLMVRSINRVNSDGAQVELEVMITGDEADEVIIEQAIGPLMIDPRVLGLSWESSVEG
jgi:putative Mg2+ transporter-C (MgtC) family protein